MRSYPNQYAVVDDIHVPRRDDQQEDLFSYSDGEEFERAIERIISEASDRSLFSAELSAASWDWRSTCHLSPVRANILRPLEEACRGRVLELGSGCGVITRFLGELGGDVVALEASSLRASITRQRTVDLPNVKVVCDRIEEFDSLEKFDVVTMIGVLQYARIFSRCGERAELELLANAARQLKDDGILVIAIQNKLGLKYFSGFPEPNVDLPNYGIENRYGSDTIIRFGLEEIRDILSSMGLQSQQLLLPLPDYHMPVSILSSSGSIPNPHFSGQTLLELSVGRDRARPDWIAPSFSLEQVWKSIYSNGLAPDLANSFLIVAGRSEQALNFLQRQRNFAWHYSVERHPAFATVKRFALERDTVVVTRELLAPQLAPSVPVTHHVENEQYLNGVLWWDVLVEIVNTPGWSVTDVCSWARRWLDVLCEQANLGPAVALSLDKDVSGAMFDWTPMNCVKMPDNTLHFFDKEWEIRSSLSLSYLIVRGLFGSLASVASCAEAAPGTPLRIIDLLREALKLQGIVITDDHVERYVVQESCIQHWINKGVDGAVNELWIKYVKEATLVFRIDQRKAHAQAQLHAQSQAQMQAQLEEAQAQLTRQTHILNGLEGQLEAMRAEQTARNNRLRSRAAYLVRRLLRFR